MLFHKEHILKEVGLTENEAVIYLQLLKTGAVLVKTLARITNMHRTSVYSCLNRLHKKGLVSMITYENKLYFDAVDPSKILALVMEREAQVKAILPELQRMHKTKFYSEHEVQYFKGKQGLKTIFEDILATRKDYVGWGPEKRIESLLKYFFIHYVQIRKERKIKGKLIYYEEAKGKPYTRNPLITVRYMPTEFYTPTAHRVYGDKVAILLLEDDPLTILIENKAIADSYRNHFEELWKIAKK